MSVKLWIKDKMYLVDEVVRDELDRQAAEIEELKELQETNDRINNKCIADFKEHIDLLENDNKITNLENIKLQAEIAQLKQNELNRQTKEIARLFAENERLKSALIWCSGSADFQIDGQARKGWERICIPLLEGTEKNSQHNYHQMCHICDEESIICRDCRFEYCYICHNGCPLCGKDRRESATTTKYE